MIWSNPHGNMGLPMGDKLVKERRGENGPKVAKFLVG